MRPLKNKDLTTIVEPYCESQVNLTAANVSTGMVTPVTSDAPGYYIFPSLVAGTPHSSRQSPDFHTFIMNGLISG